MPGLPWIQVHRVGLLDTHVRSLNLPSTPLKETEKRADGWRSHWGLEQTEIDALAALRPENLLEIVEKAIEPFWDKSLTRRTYRAREAWKQKADKVLAASVDGAFLDRARDQLTILIEGIRPQLEKLQASLEININELDLPPIPEVLPDLDGLPSPSEALFDSRNDWTTATLRLTADRSHTAETP